MPRLEAPFQRDVIEAIEKRYPNAIVFKTDPTYLWSFPDLMVLVGSRWASLETKRASKAHKQPNQDHYVRLLNQMSFGRFVNPQNLGKVMYDLERALE